MWGAVEAGRSQSCTDSSLPSETVGLDLSPVAIEFCRRAHNYPQVSFVCGDAEHLPFPAGSFDAVINIESSHSYPNVAAFYAEVYRVLEAGRRLPLRRHHAGLREAALGWNMLTETRVPGRACARHYVKRGALLR